MSPIHDEVRSALQERAGAVAPLADPMAGIERRAHRMRRRRVSAVAGSAVVVAALAVGVPLSTGVLSGHHRPVAPAGGGTDTVSPSPSTSPSAQSQPGPQQWPYVGMNTAADGATRLEFQRLLAAQVDTVWPGARVDTLVPLLGAPMTGDRLVVVAVASVQASDGTHEVAGAWVKLPDRPATVVSVHDIAADAAQVSVVLPKVGSETVPLVVVVGGPSTGQVMYAAPGKAFQPVEHLPGVQTGERWAAFPRPYVPAPGAVVDQIMVLDGDGDLAHPLYQGPIARGLTFPDI